MKLYATHTTAHGDYRIFLDSSAESGNTFYCRMGRCFADRRIAKELAEPLYDEPGYHWLLACDAAGDICAFACLDATALEKRGEVTLTYGYVFEAHRERGLHHALFEARLRLAGELGAKVVRGVANGASRSTFLAYGFEKVRDNGQYTYFRKQLNPEGVQP